MMFSFEFFDISSDSRKKFKNNNNNTCWIWTKNYANRDELLPDSLDKEKGLNIERIGVKLTSHEVHYGLNWGI